MTARAALRARIAEMDNAYPLDATARTTAGVNAMLVNLWVLVIVAIGCGNGSGAAITQLHYRTQEECLSSAAFVMKQNTHGYYEAFCVMGLIKDGEKE